MNTAQRVASHGKRRWQKDAGAFARVIQRIEPFDASELQRLELPIRMSFESIRTGKGAEQDFHDLAAAVNVAMVRSEAVDPLCEQTALAARDALLRTWARYQRTGRLGFDGPALQEVEAGISLHEQLIRNSTPLQMVEALREVVRRGAAGEVAVNA